MKFVFGAFIILHGLVHLLYFGHAMRYFELKPGLAWPDGSWAFSNLLGIGAARTLASISLILATIVFVLGGVGLFLDSSWWQLVVISGAGISILTYILFWNRRTQNLDGQGGIGVLIDIAILLAVLLFF